MDGKEQKVSFMIAPPDVSDLSQKKHNEIISEYLKEQGIKLIWLLGSLIVPESWPNPFDEMKLKSK